MLIECNNEKQTFIATDKGRYFLHTYMELNELTTAKSHKRDIISHSYYVLLTKIHIIRRVIYCVRYTITTIQSMI
jgi:hypothetical protein